MVDFTRVAFNPFEYLKGVNDKLVKNPALQSNPLQQKKRDWADIAAKFAEKSMLVGMVRDAIEGFKAPGDAFAGRLAMRDSEGNLTREGIERALGTAGLVGGGSFAFRPAGKTVLGSGPAGAWNTIEELEQEFAKILGKPIMDPPKPKPMPAGPDFAKMSGEEIYKHVQGLPEAEKLKFISSVPDDVYAKYVQGMPEKTATQKAAEKEFSTEDLYKELTGTASKAADAPQWSKHGWAKGKDPKDLFEGDWITYHDKTGKFAPMEIDNPQHIADAAMGAVAQSKHGLGPGPRDKDAAEKLLEKYGGGVYEPEDVTKAMKLIEGGYVPSMEVAPVNYSDAKIVGGVTDPKKLEDIYHNYAAHYGGSGQSGFDEYLTKALTPDAPSPVSIPISSGLTKPTSSSPSYDFSAIKPVSWEELSGTPAKMTPEALERAKALGFNPDLTLYKGMTQEIQGPGFWDPRNKSHERAQFFSDNPTIANRYTGGDVGHVTPAVARPVKPYEVDFAKFHGAPSYNPSAMNKLIDHVSGLGGDAVIIRNINDIGGLQTQYAFMDPNKLRSPVARFDPNRIHDNDLLASKGVPVFTPVSYDPFKEEGSQSP